MPVLGGDLLTWTRYIIERKQKHYEDLPNLAMSNVEEAQSKNSGKVESITKAEVTEVF